MLGSLNPKPKESLGPFLNQLSSLTKLGFMFFKTFKNLIPWLSIGLWGERQVDLDELDCSMFQNLEFRNYTN